MINANELRIGNYIEAIGDIYKVLCIDGIEELLEGESLRKYEVRHFISEYNAGNCKGVPLTEEWLVKFGFENKTTRFKEVVWNYCKSYTISHTRFKQPLTFSVFNYEGDIAAGVCEGNDYTGGATLTSIQYVHQLQNLYFALTGKELEIK